MNMRATDRGREVLQSVSARVSVQERTTTGAMRYCDLCKCIKPDRAHHCSMCMQVKMCSLYCICIYSYVYAGKIVFSVLYLYLLLCVCR